MLYVPTGPAATTDPPLPPAVAVRRALSDLRTAAGRRAWATRSPVTPAITEVPPPMLAERLAALREAAVRYVVALRNEGARPEQMLVRVKACVREAMAAEGWHDPEAAQALITQAVGWSIDAYYDR